MAEAPKPWGAVVQLTGGSDAAAGQGKALRAEFSVVLAEVPAA